MSDSPPENSPIVVKDEALPGQSSRRKQRLRRAVIVSIVAHLIGVIALLCWYIPANKSQLTDQSPATNESSNDAAPRNPPAPVKPAAPEGDEVSEDQIQKSLESQIEAVKQIPDEQKLDQLEKNLKRLESISSPESASEAAAKVSSSLGLDSDQYATKKPEDIAPGKIDLNKAQLADVKRTRNPKGGWDYVSTLVDDSGREMEVPMTQAEGEAIYETFQQMKKFPVAAGIYRSVVMPMIQKTLEATSSK